MIKKRRKKRNTGAMSLLMKKPARRKERAFIYTPREVKLFALKKYLTFTPELLPKYTYKEIRSMIKKKFGKTVALITISHWITKGGWSSLREEVKDDALKYTKFNKDMKKREAVLSLVEDVISREKFYDRYLDSKQINATKLDRARVLSSLLVDMILLNKHSKKVIANLCKQKHNFSYKEKHPITAAEAHQVWVSTTKYLLKFLGIKEDTNIFKFHILSGNNSTLNNSGNVDESSVTPAQLADTNYELIMDIFGIERQQERGDFIRDFQGPDNSEFKSGKEGCEDAIIVSKKIINKDGKG